MQSTNISPCPRCSGSRTDVGIVTGQGFNLVQFRKKGLFNKSSDVTTIVCLNCGYIEFYALDPQKLIPDR